MAHPLDNPIWNALTSRQAGFARVVGGVRRYDPAIAPFAASAVGTTEGLAGLAALASEGRPVAVLATEEIPAPPGMVLVRAAPIVQMVAERIDGPSPGFAFQALTAADAPEMRELALLTKPGPFAERTHELGRFLGVRKGGRLVAMAGERMKLDEFTEISGVCTHPDHRGNGYAAGLMREVGRAILARGETPFLHAFADNLGAIGLYERLGFAIRWRPTLLVFGAG